MRKTASEIIRNLESRVARLERQARLNEPKIDMNVIKFYFLKLGGIGSFHPETGDGIFLNDVELSQALKATHKIIQELIGKGKLDDLWDVAEREIVEEHLGFLYDYGLEYEVLDDIESMFDKFLKDYQKGYVYTSRPKGRKVYLR